MKEITRISLRNHAISDQNKNEPTGNKSASVTGLCVAQCVDCGEQYSGVENWTEGEWMAKRCLVCEGYFKGVLIGSYPEQT